MELANSSRSDLQLFVGCANVIRKAVNDAHLDCDLRAYLQVHLRKKNTAAPKLPNILTVIASPISVMAG